MRLIDADDLKQNHMFYHEADSVSYAEERDIDETPTINAVTVVRCKDCKHYVIKQLKSDYTEDKRYKPSVCIKGEFAKHRKPDWYCADGERKQE